MKLIVVLGLMLLSSLNGNCELAMEKAIRVCLKYEESNRWHKACAVADDNVTRVCGKDE